MTPLQTCYVGVAAPYALTLPINVGTSGFDLLQVTGAFIEVTLPDGSVAEWPASVLSSPPATSSDLTVQHVHVASDVPVPGPYTLRARLVTAAGNLFTKPGVFNAEVPPGPPGAP